MLCNLFSEYIKHGKYSLFLWLQSCSNISSIRTANFKVAVFMTWHKKGHRARAYQSIIYY